MKVVHIVPYDGIGGVESAAKSMGDVQVGHIDFRVDFIFKGVGDGNIRWKTFSPLPLASAAWRLSRGNVDLLIVSLWRSAIVGLLAKILRPQLQIVAFLHNSKDQHFLDWAFTRLSVGSALEIWADSEATIRSRLPRLSQQSVRVISFVARRLEPLPARQVEPSFIYWGRLSPQKGLDRAIRLFAALRMEQPEAKFRIIGPDGGCLRSLEELCVSLGVEDAVVFLGAATHDEIITHAREASFYLQTSLYEGMAMSVVESMQLGLVPVVTPVGEIASYCKVGVNSVIVKSDPKAVEDVLHLLDSSDEYQELRASAIASWKNRPLYQESVFEACNALLHRTSG